jgi:polyisoprenoid-binding protein YceI
MATTTTVRTYGIDKAHSEATFQVRYLLTKVRGRFSDFDGTIQFDEANPENSSIDFTIQATSIDTNEPDRDKHLRSDDFFAVEQFSSIAFKSKRIIKRGAETYDVVGDLTMHGVTKEITLPVAHLGAGEGSLGPRQDRVRKREQSQPQGFRIDVEHRARGGRLPHRRRGQGQRVHPGRRAVTTLSTLR